MVRCDEFYLKWDKCGNFCEKHPDTASEIEKYLDFQHEIENRGDIEPAVKAGISAISADALRPLLREPDPEIREETKTHVIKALESKKNLSNGRFKRKKRKDYSAPGCSRQAIHARRSGGDFLKALSRRVYQDPRVSR